MFKKIHQLKEYNWTSFVKYIWLCYVTITTVMVWSISIATLATTELFSVTTLLPLVKFFIDAII